MSEIKSPAAEVAETAVVREVKPVVSAASKAKTEKKTAKNAGFCVYLGPNIPNTIQTGSVFRGTKKEVLTSIAGVVEKYPLVASLIVTGDVLPTERIKVKTPGNLLYVNYHKLAGKK